MLRPEDERIADHEFYLHTGRDHWYLHFVTWLAWGTDSVTPLDAVSCGGGGVITLRQRQNGRHFTDDVFKCIFLNENVWISLKISLKFVPKGLINNIPSLVQMMAWRWPGDKPLSEPMMISLLTHICVTRPQWVNTLRPEQNDCHFIDGIFKCIFFKETLGILIKMLLKFVAEGPIISKSASFQVMARCRTGIKPLHFQMHCFCQEEFIF